MRCTLRIGSALSIIKAEMSVALGLIGFTDVKSLDRSVLLPFD